MTDITTPGEALPPEVVAAWVARRLADAPERSETWGEQVLAAYLGEPAAQQRRAA